MLHRLFRNHGLSIVMVGFFLAFLCGQIVAGRHDYNDERRKQGEPEVGVIDYESEFLQMFFYVFATAFLYQKGSAESKDPRKKHEHKTATRAVRKDSP